MHLDVNDYKIIYKIMFSLQAYKATHKYMHILSFDMNLLPFTSTQLHLSMRAGNEMHFSVASIVDRLVLSNKEYFFDTNTVNYTKNFLFGSKTN